MSIQVHLFHFNATFLSCTLDFSEFVYANIEQLQAEPSGAMEPVVVELKEILGVDVQPRRVTSFSIDGTYEEVERVYEVLSVLAAKYTMLVLWGDSGPLFNYTGEVLTTEPLHMMRNSAGAQWWQVTERTLHEAFEDAIRWPQPFVEIKAQNAQDNGQLGEYLKLSPLEAGTFRVVRRSEFWAQSCVAEDLDHAVELALLWADRCPLILEMNWQVCELEDDVLLNLKDRALTTVPRHRHAIFNLPAGFYVRNWDAWTASLGYGRTPDGDIFASCRNVYGLGLRKNFTSIDELNATLRGFLDGEVEINTEQGWQMEDPVYDLDVYAVTAMVLPERQQVWTDVSIRAMHRAARVKNQDDASPDVEIRSFVDAVNERAGTDLILAESEVEAKPLTTIFIPRQTADVTRERLQWLATGFNISLVLNGDQVFLNPGQPFAHNGERSAKATGHPCVVEVRKGGHAVRRYQGTDLTMLADAFPLLNTGAMLTVKSSEIVPLEDRRELIFTAAEPGLNVAFESPHAISLLRNVATMGLSQMTYEFSQNPDEFARSVNWEETHEKNVEGEENRYQYGDSLDVACIFDPAVVEHAIENVLVTSGRWVVLHDRSVAGDYCQIDSVGPNKFVVEWGHNYGEVENFQATFQDARQAVHRWLQFMELDIDDFAALEWVRQTP